MAQEMEINSQTINYKNALMFIAFVNVLVLFKCCKYHNYTVLAFQSLIFYFKFIEFGVSF